MPTRSTTSSRWSRPTRAGCSVRIACHLYLLDPAREELDLRASDPEPGGARETLGLAELGPELARGGRSTRLAIPLVATGELIGLLVAEGSTRVELGRAVASQVAVGIKKVQVIEQLTEKNLIKDFLEELAGGRPRGDLEGRAARLGCDLDQPHVVLVAEPWSDALARRSGARRPGRSSTIARTRCAPSSGSRRPRASRSSSCLKRIHAELGEPVRSGSRASAGARRRTRTDSPRPSRR